MSHYDKIPEGLLESFRQENCVLFLGAGVSIDSGLPKWSDVMSFAVQELSSTLDDVRELDLLEVGQCYEYKLNRRSLVNNIIRQINAPEIKPNKIHEQIIRLPFNTIITTNWDQLVEFAYAEFFEVKPQCIYEDKQIGIFDNSSVPMIIKMHGCISNPQSIVVTEKDYYNFLTSHPILVDLITTKIANSTLLFLGYSLNDFDLKLLISRVFTLLGSMSPTLYFFAANETQTRIEYLRSLNVRPVIFNDKEKGKSQLLSIFLDSLLEKVSIVAHNKIDRAKMLVRENQIQLMKASAHMRNVIIRNISNLGGWGTPQPSTLKEAIFDDESTPPEKREIDELEWKATQIWKQFYEKGASFRCIYSINADWLSKKYSLEVARKRFQTFYDNIIKLDPDRVQIVNRVVPIDVNKTIYARDEFLLSLYKSSPNQKAYDHGRVTRNKTIIIEERNLFDAQFEAIKGENLLSLRKMGKYDDTKSETENLKTCIIIEVEKALKSLKNTN